MEARDVSRPLGQSTPRLFGGALIFTLLLVGSQVARGGDWAWLSVDDQLVFAAVAIVGSLAGGVLIRDWRWTLAASAAVGAFASLALAAIARESGMTGMAKALGSWGVSWPLLVVLVALLVAAMGALGVFAGIVLTARRSGVPWQTMIPPHLAGLGPALVGAVAYALLLIVALEAWWPWFFPLRGMTSVAFLLMTPVVIGAFMRSRWWYLGAPLGVLWATMVGLSIGGFLLIGVIAAAVAALLAVVGVRVLGPQVEKLDARTLRLVQGIGGIALVTILSFGLFGWAEQRLGTEPWWPGNASQGPVMMVWRAASGDNATSWSSAQSYIAPTSYPVIIASADTVYTTAGSRHTPVAGEVVALDAETGHQRWSGKLPRGWSDLFVTRPDAVILLGNHIVAETPPSPGGARWWFEIWALAAATGETRWSFRPGGGGLDTVALDEARNHIVTPCQSNERSAVCAIASGTGAEVWHHLLAPSKSSPTASEVVTLTAADGVAYVIADDGTATALDGESGEVRWRVQAAAAPERDPVSGQRAWTARLTVGDDAIFLSREESSFAPNLSPAFEGSQLIAIDRARGQVRWEFQPADVTAPRGLSPVAIDSAQVYVADSRGTLTALDAASGAERWRFMPDAPVSARSQRSPLFPAVVAGETIIFSPGGIRPGWDMEPSTIYGIDAASGHEQWAAQLPGHLVSTPVVMNDTVVVTTGGDAALLALDLSTGEQRWRAGSIGNMVSAPAVVGNTVYVTTTTVHYGLLGYPSFSGSAIIAFRVAG